MEIAQYRGGHAAPGPKNRFTAEITTLPSARHSRGPSALSHSN
jgi:hypothetical protein